LANRIGTVHEHLTLHLRDEIVIIITKADSDNNKQQQLELSVF